MTRAIRKISSHYVWTPQGWLKEAILSFDPSGLLVEIATPGSIDSQAGVEFFSGLLIPGMVNAHAHLELSYLHEKIAPGGGLSGFIAGMVRTRGGSTPAEREAAFAYWDHKMYREGITAVGEICNGASTFEHKQKSPIYYHNFIERFGLAVSDFSAVEAVEAAARQAGLVYSSTPHSTYSLQDAPFRTVVGMQQDTSSPVAQAAEAEKPTAPFASDLLSIHFQESRSEAELFAGRGLLHERNREAGIAIDFAHYGSPAGRLIACIPPKRNMLLIHNTFVTRQQVLALEHHFTGRLTWVLCPRSNAYIEGTLPPVSLLRELGVHIALGTDSLASNRSLSLVEEMKALGGEVPLDELIRWATSNGAQALGIDSWAGSFAVGKRPGAVLLTNIDWPHRALTPQSRSERIV